MANLTRRPVHLVNDALTLNQRNPLTVCKVFVFVRVLSTPPHSFGCYKSRLLSLRMLMGIELFSPKLFHFKNNSLVNENIHFWTDFKYPSVRRKKPFATLLSADTQNL